MIIGKNGISAKVVADSLSSEKTRMTTYEIEMPRIILAELNTHKILNRNSQSSRAVPVKSAIEQVQKNGFAPVFWGKNQAGMTAKEECNELINGFTREEAWAAYRDAACANALEMFEAGYHKQIANRMIEPFQMIRLVFGGTEFDNLFNLRLEYNAQPEIRELVRCIYLAKQASTPVNLRYGEWHLPYIHRERVDGTIRYYGDDGKELSLDEARTISLSSVAQVSYRKQDTSLEKAQSLLGKLFNGDVVHASPAEHIATPLVTYQTVGEKIMNVPMRIDSWEKGVTHMDRNMELWSGNLRGFIQYRQLIDNHVCTNFTDAKFQEYMKDYE